MKHLLRKCLICKICTLKNQCSHCSSMTVDPTPAKFSPEDKYILYRLPESYNKKETNQENIWITALIFFHGFYGVFIYLIFDYVFYFIYVMLITLN